MRTGGRLTFLGRCADALLLVLNMLMTHPEHQRRGAGKMLVQQGTDLADKGRLPCYLEGSPQGHRLYLDMGFEDLETVDMDGSKFGSEGIHLHYVMVRPAKEK